jgi:hypothetical protein
MINRSAERLEFKYDSTTILRKLLSKKTPNISINSIAKMGLHVISIRCHLITINKQQHHRLTSETKTDQKERFVRDNNPRLVTNRIVSNSLHVLLLLQRAPLPRGIMVKSL